MLNLSKLSESIIRAGANPQSYQRGYDLWQDGAISNTAIQGALLTGECAGTSAPYYTLRVELDEGGIRSASCSCPYEFGGYCKHEVALLLAYVHEPAGFARRKPPSELLADLDRETLAALLTKLLRDRPELIDWVEAAIATPSGKSKQSKRKTVDAEVYRRQVRGIIHSLDRMRSSEAYWHVGGLVGELEGLKANAVKFLDAGEADTAPAILLALIEEADEGFEVIDDSDGEFGGYLSDIGQPLAEAILMLDLSAVERQQLTERLKKADRQLSNYGVDNALDVALEALEFGWETPSRSRPAAQAEDWDDDEEYESDDYDDEDEVDTYEAVILPGGGSGYQPGDLIEAKLNVLQRQNRIDEYLALCQAAGRHLRYALKLCELDRVTGAVEFAQSHLTTTGEALQLAQHLRTLNQLAEALTIGEHGLKLNGNKRSLAEWLAPIEEAQGRQAQALEAWVAAFNENPTLETYKTLQHLAGSQWTTLRPDLMAVLHKGYSKLPLAQVLIYEETWSDAMALADQPTAGYSVVEIVADAVIHDYPDWVVRVERATRRAFDGGSEEQELSARGGMAEARQSGLSTIGARGGMAALSGAHQRTV